MADEASVRSLCLPQPIGEHQQRTIPAEEAVAVVERLEIVEIEEDEYMGRVLRQHGVDMAHALRTW
jgi:hypothetical protein